MNNMDLCPDTPVTQSVDMDGCSEQQKDDDEDGIKNHVDECPNTPEGELIDAVGCALIQLDSDGDGVNDAEDAFKSDANESVDSDNDGVADRWDAYPEDPTRSCRREGIWKRNVVRHYRPALGRLLGGGGYFYTRKPELAATSPFGDAMDAMDSATEQNMAGARRMSRTSTPLHLSNGKRTVCTGQEMKMATSPTTMLNPVSGLPTKVEIVFRRHNAIGPRCYLPTMVGQDEFWSRPKTCPVMNKRKHHLKSRCKVNRLRTKNNRFRWKQSPSVLRLAHQVSSWASCWLESSSSPH